MLDQHSESALPWYKQFWPWFLIALPLTVVVASFYTLMLAINNPDALVQDSYYKDGLAINQRLHQDELAKRFKLRATVILDNKSFASLRIDLDGMLEQTPQTLYLKLYSPSQVARDRQIELLLQDDGFYHAALGGPLSGRWYLDLSDADLENTDFKDTGLENINLEDTAHLQSGWRLKGEWDTRRHPSLVLSAP